MCLKLIQRSYCCCSLDDHRSLSILLQGPVPRPHLSQIHARVFRLGADQNNLIATRLIGQYPTSPLRLLALLRSPNIFPFNAAIRVLSESAPFAHSLATFNSLKLRSIPPNAFTFSFLLKACLRSGDPLHVPQIHTHLLKSGLLDFDPCLSNGLLSAYATAGDIVSARYLFDEMPDKRIGRAWACLIAGYARRAQPDEALMLFLRMVRENLAPVEDDTMVSVMSACSNLDIGEIDKWVCIFSVDANQYFETVLIYLYGKWGKIERSRDLFDNMIGRGERRSSNVVTWNSIIDGYMHNCRPLEALCLFHRMVDDDSNPKPNHVTIVSVLSACALVGDLDLGRWAHEYVKSKGSKRVAESNKILATAFIDMYSKCGSLKEAKNVFYGMDSKDVVSFNAMIMGLAINSQAEEALRLSDEMEKLNVQPNDGTLLGLLCACTHSGLVEQGRKIFTKMQRKYLVTPKLEHYACYVDLLSRAGHVEEALEVVETMPVDPNALVWGALLGACLVHSRLDVARVVATRFLDVDPGNSAGYVMLSNAYAIQNDWADIAHLRGLMKVRNVRKQPGSSWIGIDGVMHEFRVGSLSHPQMHEIIFLLDCLSRKMKSASMGLVCVKDSIWH